LVIGNEKNQLPVTYKTNYIVSN